MRQYNYYQQRKRFCETGGFSMLSEKLTDWWIVRTMEMNEEL